MENTENFNKKEFFCKCCKIEHMNQGFIGRLQIARNVAKIPFKINSGWRCSEHNKKVGGSKNSSHLIGRAADIAVEGWTRAARNKNRGIILAALYRVGFHRIGIAEKFIHVDDDPDKPEDVAWLY